MYWLAHETLGLPEEIELVVVCFVLIVFVLALWRGKRIDAQQEQEKQELPSEENRWVD